jgi:hypothetical protein
METVWRRVGLMLRTLVPVEQIPIAATASSAALASGPEPAAMESWTGDVNRGKLVGATLVDLVKFLQTHLPSTEKHLSSIVSAKFDDVYKTLHPLLPQEQTFFDEIQSQVHDVLVR